MLDAEQLYNIKTWASGPQGVSLPADTLALVAVAEAAAEYVAARLANESASPDAWFIALSRVDAAWHALVLAVEGRGTPDAESETR